MRRINTCVVLANKLQFIVLVFLTSAYVSLLKVRAVGTVLKTTALLLYYVRATCVFIVSIGGGGYIPVCLAQQYTQIWHYNQLLTHPFLVS